MPRSAVVAPTLEAETFRKEFSRAAAETQSCDYSTHSNSALADSSIHTLMGTAISLVVRGRGMRGQILTRCHARKPAATLSIFNPANHRQHSLGADTWLASAAMSKTLPIEWARFARLSCAVALLFFTNSAAHPSRRRAAQRLYLQPPARMPS